MLWIQPNKAIFPVLLLAVAVATGCARKPFGPALEGDQRRAGEARYSRYLEADSSCSPGFDGEIVVRWQSTFDSFAFSGYFQALSAAYFRFSATTPLGQTLFAMSSNGSSFQAVDPGRRHYLAGSLRSWGIRHQISNAFITGPWTSWLAGRPPPEATKLVSVHVDDQARGTWYGVSSQTGTTVLEYLLVEPEQGRLLKRIILDRAGKMQAELAYGQWEEVGACRQPMEISISGLSFGTEAVLGLTDVQPAELTPADFSISPPPNYQRTLLP